MSTIYRTDFYAWTKDQVALLEAGALNKLDLRNIKEEIETMGRRERNALGYRIEILLVHLLKWRHQFVGKGRHPNSWRNKIQEQRRCIDRLLRANPSLRLELLEIITYEYEGSCAAVTLEPGMTLSTLPVDCPWTVDEILDEDWLPG